MTTLRPMRPELFETYVVAAIAGYAQENVAAGRWPQTGAQQRARADFAALLPQGLATPDHFLFEVVADGEGLPVGYAWLAIERKYGAVAAHVYGIEIKPEHRRQGHASRALQALESVAVAQGARSIGLNVFAPNTGAQTLYRQLGYLPTNMSMRKPLRTAGD